MYSNDETDRVVLLDYKFQPLGEALKTEVHNATTQLHLAFSCYIFNDNNELLVTQRAVTKKVWPGVWTGSFCGHPAPGEDMQDAIIRRADFELNTKLKNIRQVVSDYAYITPPYKGIVEHEFCPIYFAQLKDPLIPLNPNKDEVEDFRWTSVELILHDIAYQEDVYSYWFKDQLELLVSKGIL